MIEEIKKTIEVLQKGGIILYPTDTIWGIGCDATNQEAVARIYEIKNRADSKSMLVLLDTDTRLQQYVDEVPEVAWELIDVADKPMTIIYPNAKNLAPNLIAENGSVGIRIAQDEFCRKLIARFKKPIVSSSANISGSPSPAVFNEIDSEILEAVDFVVNWKQEEIVPAEPSSIIELGISGQINILRK